MVEAMEIQKGFKQTEVGIIPSDWDVKSLGQFGIVHGRVGWKGYTKKDIRNSGPYAIGAKHIDKSNRLDLSDPTYLSIEKYLESPEIMVFKEDILIVQRGSIGKVVLIDREIGEATINPSMVIFRLKKNSPVYVFYYLISSPGQNQIVFDTSSTGVPMITQKQVSNFKIPLPPTKTEQTAIATALNDADALITQLEKLIAKKRAIKQGAMQELLKPKEGWEVKKLGEIFEITAGGDYKRKSSSDIKNDKHIHPIYSNSLSNKGLFGYCTYFSNEPNCITVTARGTIGYSFYRDHKFTAIGRLLVLKSKTALNCFFFSEYINNKIEFVLEITGVPQLTAPQISQYEVCYPKEKTEQTRIAQILSDMDTEIEALGKKLEKHKMLKQGMLQNLLTGKIRLI